jgi:ABC-type transporter Mla subunit MlaD
VGPQWGLAAASRVVGAGTGLLTAAVQIPGLLDRAHNALAGFESLLARVHSTVAGAQALVGRIELTRTEAAAVVDHVAELENRVTALLRQLQPVLDAIAEVDPRLVIGVARTTENLQPLLGALSGLNADVPDEAVSFLRRSTPLLDQVDRLVLPLLEELRAAVPDVREILPTVRRLEPVMVDVETRIAGLPGAGRMRKRGEREIDDANPDSSLTAS